MAGESPPFVFSFLFLPFLFLLKGMFSFGVLFHFGVFPSLFAGLCLSPLFRKSNWFEKKKFCCVAFSRPFSGDMMGLLVWVVYGLISFMVASAWLCVFIPWRWWMSPMGLLHMAFAHTLLGLTVYCYRATVNTCPGRVPAGWVLPPSLRPTHWFTTSSFFSVFCVVAVAPSDPTGSLGGGATKGAFHFRLSIEQEYASLSLLLFCGAAFCR